MHVMQHTLWVHVLRQRFYKMIVMQCHVHITISRLGFNVENISLSRANKDCIPSTTICTKYPIHCCTYFVYLGIYIEEFIVSSVGLFFKEIFIMCSACI